MHKQRIKKIGLRVLLAICFVVGSQVTVTGQSNFLRGDSSFAIGSSMVLEDDLYMTSSASKSNIVIRPEVRFKYDQLNISSISPDFTVSVVFSLMQFGRTGASLPTRIDTLQLSHAAISQELLGETVFLSPDTGVYRAVLEVEGISGSSHLTEDIVLELSLVKDRWLDMSENISGLAIGDQYFSNSNELEIYWDYFHGADGYELEWVFLSSEVYGGASFNSKAFKNATRVVTHNQQYKVSVPYAPGTLYYRLRGFRNANKSLGQNKKYTNWKENSGTQKFVVDTALFHEKSLSWSYTSVFSSDGNKGEQITYLDPTGRVRQMIVKDDENENIIVGEQKYGFNGEPLVQILPGILPGNQIAYIDSFTLSGGGRFEKEDYAKDTSFVDPPALDISSRNYFSSGNPFIGDGLHDYIADAGGYGYVQTLFDAQGRVTKVSGIGEHHKMGSDHEVQIWYGNPSQEELDRLFGNEVGYAEHYSKVQTQDANGVIKTSYYNLSDQLIGTAIVGNRPNELAEIENNNFASTKNVSYDLAVLNHYSEYEKSTIINYDFLASSEQDYTLNYELTRDWYNNNCTPGVDYECRYILELYVTDNQDVRQDLIILSGGGANITYDSTTQTITGVLDSSVFGVSDVFSLEYLTHLKVGQYKVWKKLTVDREGYANALALYKAETEAGNNICIEEFDSVKTRYEDLYFKGLRCDPCEFDCADLVNRYYSFTGGVESSSPSFGAIFTGVYDSSLLAVYPVVDYEFNPGISPANWQSKYDQCIVEFCDKGEFPLVQDQFSDQKCEGMKVLFTQDLQPGGQYFDNRGVGDELDIADNRWLKENILPGPFVKRRNGFSLKYPDPEDPSDNLHYSSWGALDTLTGDESREEFDFETAEGNDGTDSTEQVDGYRGIRKNFQRGQWGEDTDDGGRWWRYHPEVCEYLYCDATIKYEKQTKLFSTITYAQASSVLPVSPELGALHMLDFLYLDEASKTEPATVTIREKINENIYDPVTPGLYSKVKVNGDEVDEFLPNYRFKGDGTTSGHIDYYYANMTHPSCPNVTGMKDVSECLAWNIYEDSTLLWSDAADQEKIWDVYKMLYRSARGAYLLQVKYAFKSKYGGSCWDIAQETGAPKTLREDLISGKPLYTYNYNYPNGGSKEFEINFPDFTKFALGMIGGGGSLAGAGDTTGFGVGETSLINLLKTGTTGEPENITNGIISTMINEGIVSAILCKDGGPSYEWLSNSNWFFGEGIIASFNQGTTGDSLTFHLSQPGTGSSYLNYEGSSVVSDNLGNLLYYTNGTSLLDSAHNVKSSSLLTGTENSGTTGSSAAQGALFVKHPSSNDTVYVFTVDDNLTSSANEKGLNYWRLVLSTGTVTGPTRLLTDSGATYRSTEVLTAAFHQNGKDIWIVARESGRNTGASKYENIYSYLLSDSGLTNQITRSQTLPVINAGLGEADRGSLKISWDGERAALVTQYTEADNRDHSIELFDFDNKTGELRNPIGVSGRMSSFGFPYEAGELGSNLVISPYACEFSPNSKGLYVVGKFKDENHSVEQSAVLFAEIQGSLDTLINKGFEKIMNLTSGTDPYQVDIRLARDGKLYVPKLSTNAMYVLEGSLNTPFVYDSLVLSISETALPSGRDVERGLGQSFVAYCEEPEVPQPNCFCENLMKMREDEWFKTYGVHAPIVDSILYDPAHDGGSEESFINLKLSQFYASKYPIQTAFNGSIDTNNYAHEERLINWYLPCKNRDYSFQEVPAFIQEFIDDCPPTDCKEEATEKARTDAISEWNRSIENRSKDFEKEYFAACLRGDSVMNEKLTISFEVKENYYTLYYYDLAGDLVATVYPEGVRPLDSAKVSQVSLYRSKKQGSGIYLKDQHVNSQINEFTYNSLGEVLESKMVDGGTSKYFYDNLGRIIASQDASQADIAGPTGGDFSYNYTLYDTLGRISESGAMTMQHNLLPLNHDIARADTNASYSFSDWLSFGVKSEVSRIGYDYAVSSASDAAIELQSRGINSGQDHNRNRITAVYFHENGILDSATENYNMAYYYAYNEHGLVETFMQEHASLDSTSQQFKVLNYDFDLFSGLVHEVAYQQDQQDAFYTRYEYDKLNRLKRTYTSADKVIWNLDGKNIYYNHGAKARVELGHHQIQGLDIAYTVRGELKALNSSTLDATRDIGGDGANGFITSMTGAKHKGANMNFARDAAGFSLGYFNGDYESVTPLMSSELFEPALVTGSAQGEIKELFNGMITSSATAIYNQNTTGDLNAATQLSVYGYDQLYRLKEVQVFRGSNVISSNSWASASLDAANKESSSYYSAISYDMNGNITSLVRNTLSDGSSAAMDSMIYSYNKVLNGTTGLIDLKSNRLYHVQDVVSTAGADYNGSNSVDNSSDFATQNNNYFKYNASGYIIENKADGYKISWTANRKIKAITRYDNVPGPNVEFKYDAFGRRIAKIVKDRIDTASAGTYVEVSGDEWTYEYYGLDASGNQLAVYKHKLDLNSGSVCASGISYGILGFNNYTGSDTLTVTVTAPGGSPTVYTLSNATQTYPENFVTQINNNGSSPLTASLLGYNGNFVRLDAIAPGTQYDGTNVVVTDGTNLQGLLLKGIFGGQDVVPSCYSVLETKLEEHVIYADSRLGIYNHYSKVLNTGSSSTDNIYGNVYGDRYYQITNWLGSVISVVRDMKYLESSERPDLIYSSSFEGGDSAMFTNNADATYNRSTERVHSGTYSLKLNYNNANQDEYGPNIIAPNIKTGDTINLSVWTNFKADTIGMANGKGGEYVYELLDDQGNFLYLSDTVTRQWRSLGTNGDPADTWVQQSTGNWIVPQTYLSDGTPYTGTLSLQVYAWVHSQSNPTYFDDLYLEILTKDSLVETYYTAVIDEASDYHEFGQRMEGRGFQSATGAYRYGYQGSEKDNEINGAGNSYTTEFRQLDPRLGRWFSPDPIFMPWQSPYTSMDNDPVNLNDPPGSSPQGLKYKKDAKDGDIQSFHSGLKNKDGTEHTSYWIFAKGKWIYTSKEGIADYEKMKQSLPEDQRASFTYEDYLIQSHGEQGAQEYLSMNGFAYSNDDLKPIPEAPSTQHADQKEVEQKTFETTKSPTPKSGAAKTPAQRLTENSPVSKTASPWVDFAKTQKGITENKSKSVHNQKIVEYVKSTGLGESYWTDETAWCASFAHYCLQQSGISGAGAKGDNWSNWGQSLDKPAVGAIVVFNTGHVAMVAGQTQSGQLVLIHGNWSNKVTLSPYGFKMKQSDSGTAPYIKDIRYPTGFTPNYNLPVIKREDFN